MVDEQRKIQIDEQVAKLVAEYLEFESNRQSLITVTRADVSSNLANAKIYISVLPHSMERNALDFCKRKRKEIKQYIKKNTHLRKIPFIDFEIDEGEKNRQIIENLSHQNF